MSLEHDYAGQSVGQLKQKKKKKKIYEYNPFHCG